MILCTILEIPTTPQLHLFSPSINNITVFINMCDTNYVLFGVLEGLLTFVVKAEKHCLTVATSAQ